MATNCKPPIHYQHLHLARTVRELLAKCQNVNYVLAIFYSHHIRKAARFSLHLGLKPISLDPFDTG